jgi:molybdate transport system ATP-binding protein
VSGGGTSLEVAIRHRLERIAIDVRLRAGGGLTAIVGPSGAGKTTLLHVIAGLIVPDEGTVVVGDDVLVDRGRGVVVPPDRRRIGYVTQDSRLFPHLTVRQNLAYGRWFTPPDRRRLSVEAVADMLDLGAFLTRRPARLSGGERQRVALGRALVTSPRLLLLDEPLAAVDVGRRPEILPYLDRLRQELALPTVYVTHTLEEVRARAESIVTLDDGRVVDVTAGGGVQSRAAAGPQVG